LVLPLFRVDLPRSSARMMPHARRTRKKKVERLYTFLLRPVCGIA
jgi:hypothetical protein